MGEEQGLKIEDSFTLKATQGDVWRAIMDPGTVAPCVPGCEHVEVLGPNSYRANVKVKVGTIKANFRLNIEITKAPG